MAETATSQPAARYEGQSERIRQPAQVVALLRRLRDTHTLLTITVPGTERQFNSMVLDVNAGKGYLLLDELNHPQGHKLVSQAGHLRAHGRCQGVQLNFACTIKVARARDGGIVYQAPLPGYITYLQRRAVYRVPVGMGDGLRLLVPAPGGEVDALPCDLSTAGIGARTEDPRGLEPDTIIEHCALELPGQAPVTVTLDIRYVQPEGNLHRFGARFVDLGPEQKNALRHTVTHLEREMLRRGGR